MGTCAKISRWGLIVFNALFLAAGLAVLAAGIYFYVQAGAYGVPRNFSVGAMVVAIFVIVIALVGLVAAIIINKIMLWIYFALLVIILAGEIAVAVVAYKYTSTLESFLGDQYRNNLSETERAAIENGFSCCGFLNTTDFNTPNSTCCQAVNNYNMSNPAPRQDPAPSNRFDVYYCYYNPYNNDGYVKSCLDAYYSFYSLYIIYLQAGAGVLAGIEVFGLIFAIALAIQADEASKDIEMADYS